MRCTELVRTRRGQTGWVFRGNLFQATTPGAPGPLGECGSRARPQPIARFATVLAFPDAASSVIERTVVYGVAPPGTGAVRLGGRPIALAPAGGFLALLGPREREDGLTLTFVSRDRRTTRVPLAHPDEEPRLPPGFKGPALLTPVAGSERAEARAPDPAGGPRWAVPVADTKEGPPCVGQPGQVVGDRIGWVDTTYGLFTATQIRRAQCFASGPQLSDTRPCSIGWGGAGVDDPLRDDGVARRAKTERRVSGGRFSITATCRDDVDRVTIRTPRDLRTLAPSPRGHIVFALYDGDFPAGEIVVSAHLRTGATRSQRFTPSL